MNLRELKLNKSFEKIVTYKNLKAVYSLACKRLSAKHPDDPQWTISQKEFAHILKNKTKLKFYENVWIGNRNVDFFMPGIKVKEEIHYRSNGIVFEIDGGIHNDEIKMKKDHSLFEQLIKLDLFVKSIKNEDLNAITVHSDLNRILKYPRTTSRERKRLWRNIYIYTIFKSMDREHIKICFGMEGLYYIEKLGAIYGK